MVISKILIFFIGIGVALAQNSSPKPLPADQLPEYPPDYCERITEDEIFDYIVVGAGPAGSVVARRLAEIPDNKVLLIEAGGDPSPPTEVAGFAGAAFPSERYQYYIENDPNMCFGSAGRRCPIKPGKALGGSTIVNFMLAVRGNKKDFDRWNDMGNPGWTFEECRPYFNKFQNFLGAPITKEETNDTVSSKYHAVGGPITISRFKKDFQTFEASEAFIESAIENGLKYNPDPNGESQMGVADLYGFVNTNGFRYNAAKGYLQNIPNNLKVCKFSVVDKVVFKGKRAVGVEFKHEGSARKIVKARIEVILSAGAYHSSCILERSGIGNRTILEKLNIPVLVDNPNVGENLRDHYVNFLMFGIDYNNLFPLNPFTIGFTSKTGFINTKNSSSEVPDIQFFIKTWNAFVGEVIDLKLKVQLEFDLVLPHLLLGGPTVLHQKVPGSIHIEDIDPESPPRIISNYYNHPEDVDAVVKSSRLFRKIMTTGPMRKFGTRALSLRSGNCNKLKFNSPEEIMCNAKYNSVALYHTAGTTGMGYVIDAKCRVLGVEGLRVIDGGSMPTPVSGNSEFSTLMFAEKSVDDIKKSHSVPLRDDEL